MTSINTFQDILKYNHNHGKDGRFASASGSAVGSSAAVDSMFYNKDHFNSIAEKSREIIDRSDESYSYYGIRVQEKDTETVGKEMAHNSRNWGGDFEGELSDRDGEELPGVSSIGIDNTNMVAGYGGYEGTVAYLLGSDTMEYGHDAGEYILENPNVLAKFCYKNGKMELLESVTGSDKKMEKVSEEQKPQRKENPEFTAFDRKMHEKYGDDIWGGKMTDDEIDEYDRLENLRFMKSCNEDITQSFSDILKFNPYHGPDGRFTGPGAATSFTYKPGAGKMYDNAIAREKERTAAAAGGEFGITPDQHEKLEGMINGGSFATQHLRANEYRKEIGMSDDDFAKYKQKYINEEKRAKAKEVFENQKREKQIQEQNEQRRLNAEMDARIRSELPGLSQDSIQHANNASMFDHGSVAAREALGRLDSYRERNKVDDNWTDEQKAYSKQREAEYKQLLTEYYNDSNRRWGDNPGWHITGPAGRNNRAAERRSQAAQNKAEEYEEKLKRFEENTNKKLKSMEPEEKQIARWRNGKWSHGETIDAADPLAEKKLQAKIDYLRESNEQSKAANKYWNKNHSMSGFEGFSEEKNQKINSQLERIYSDSSKIRSPFSTTNNSAEIRRTESRLKDIQSRKEKASSGATGDRSFNGGTLVHNTGNNRLQLIFDGKPSVEVRNQLKRNGFHWKASENAWQRQLTPNAERAAESILSTLNKSARPQTPTFSSLIEKNAYDEWLEEHIELDGTEEAKRMKEKLEKSDNTYTIAKADEDKRLVFGWGNVAVTKDGRVVEDMQGDIIDPDEFENSVYDYVLNFRNTGEEHIPDLRKKGRLVESVYFTKEKLQAMGIPEGTVPLGWWLGFYIDDDLTWQRIKSGKYRMFSIEGKGMREKMDDMQKSDRINGCGVLVLRGNKLLTATRIGGKHGNQIGGPGGHIEYGETPEEAAIRETREEFGIECKNLKRLDMLDGGRNYGKSVVFICTEYDGIPKTDDEEMRDLKWRTVEELQGERLFYPFEQSLSLISGRKKVVKTFGQIMKFNPYHGPDGRFTGPGAATSFTWRPGASAAHDKAIQREKERTAAGGFQSKITGNSYEMPKLESEQAEKDREKALDHVERYFSTKTPVKEKYDAQMKVYLDETDPAEWNKRANKDVFSIGHNFVAAKTRAQKQQEAEQKKDRASRDRALDRAAMKRTQSFQRYKDYENSLMEKYSNGWNYRDWRSKVSYEEAVKLDELRAATVFRNKRGQWQIAKSFSDILKFNPYHGPDGRFAGPGGYASFSANPATKAGKAAIRREQKKNPLIGAAYGTKHTKGQIEDEKRSKEYQKRSKAILSSYGVNSKEAQGEIRDLYRDIDKNGGMRIEEGRIKIKRSTMDRIKEISEKTAKSYEYEDNSTAHEYKAVKDFLKGTKINISDYDKNDIADFNQYRKENFGNVTVSGKGISIDTIYGQLAGKFPHLFNSDSNSSPSDQLKSINDTLNSLKPKKIRLSNEEAAGMAKDLSNDIVKQYFNSKGYSFAA